MAERGSQMDEDCYLEKRRHALSPVYFPQVRLKSTLDGSVIIEDGKKEVIIGEGDSELSETLDKCLLCMHVEAVWQVKVQPDCDFCLEESEHKSVPPSPAAILYELELLSFTKAKEVWETSPEEKLHLAVHHKSRGTDCFKAKKWLAAARRYSRALRQLILVKGKIPEEQAQEYDQLKLLCHLNLAACQGKLQQHKHVVQNCTKVLTMDRDNIKGLYRRGQAYTMLNEFEKAKEDLNKALELKPGNLAVQEQLAFLKEKQRQQDAALSKALGAMFGCTRRGK